MSVEIGDSVASVPSGSLPTSFLTGVNGASISAWVYLGESPVQSSVGVFLSDGHVRLAISVMNMGGQVFALGISGIDVSTTDGVSAAISPVNGWHHIACVSSFVDGTVEVFIDGNKTTNSTGTSSASSSDECAAIAAFSSADGTLFEDIRIWDRALSDAEVALIYSSGEIGGGPDDEVAQWEFYGTPDTAFSSENDTTSSLPIEKYGGSSQYYRTQYLDPEPEPAGSEAILGNLSTVSVSASVAKSGTVSIDNTSSFSVYGSAGGGAQIESLSSVSVVPSVTRGGRVQVDNASLVACSSLVARNGEAQISSVSELSAVPRVERHASVSIAMEDSVVSVAKVFARTRIKARSSLSVGSSVERSGTALIACTSAVSLDSTPDPIRVTMTLSARAPAMSVGARSYSMEVSAL